MAYYGSTNGVALGWDGISCDAERVAVFREMCWVRFSALLRGELEADPIKVFVKQEPHKHEKIREGRFRLISAVSLVDTMMDRIISGFLAKQMLKTVGQTPCMVGWTPLYGGHRLLAAMFDDKVLCLDKTMWDWTVPPWLIEAWMNFMLNIPIMPPDWWCGVVRKRFELLFRFARFRFLDGTECEQPCWGVMKSGCFWTIMLNSLGQSLCHYVVSRRLGWTLDSEFEPKSMGDDTVQRAVVDLPRYEEELRKLGVKPKRGVEQDWIEFAGFAITRDCAWPSYWRKHLYILRHMDEQYAVEMLESYQLLYTYEPGMLSLIQRELVRRDPTKVRTQLELQMLFQ